MSAQTAVYTGLWINHSRGLIRGATITLSNKYGDILSNFLVLLITVAGGYFWTIFSYAAHQTSTEPGPHSAIHYQQQAILKNSATAIGAAWQFLRVSLEWRNHTRRKVWQSRTLGYVLSALAISAAFTTSGLLSSQVNKAAGLDLLIKGTNCGSWMFEVDKPGLIGWQLKTLGDANSAASYAGQCYGKNHTDPLQCNTYHVPELSWTGYQNVSCPFEAGTCYPGNTSAYQMDTGPLESYHNLGINSKPSDRITLRKVATCSPLRTQKYTNIDNRTLGGGDTVSPYIRIYLGPLGNTSKWTYEYNMHSIYGNLGYSLKTIAALAKSDSLWVPIPAFNRTDADVEMFFLAANSVSYNVRNMDPMFQATLAFNYTAPNTTTTFSTFLADFYVTLLGCTEQYQFCNPTLGPSGCTTLASLKDLIPNLGRINFNSFQYETAIQIVVAMRAASMYYSVNGRGSTALKAQATLFDQTQVAALPHNQWQIEASGWFNVSLAIIQQALLERATGPEGVVELGGYVARQSSEYARAICQRQMVRNVSGYQNFSTLGVVIILVIGSLLIMLGLMIESIVSWFQSRLGKDYKRLAWTEDGYLQLLRSAYEGAGYSDWKGFTSIAPTTNRTDGEGQMLGGLDISDLEHPRLVRNVQQPVVYVQEPVQNTDKYTPFKYAQQYDPPAPQQWGNGMETQYSESPSSQPQGVAGHGNGSGSGSEVWGSSGTTPQHEIQPHYEQQGNPLHHGGAPLK